MGISQSNEISRTCTVDRKGVRKYSRTYRVITDTPQAGPYNVGSSLGINFYDHWNGGETDVYAYMTDATMQPESDMNDTAWLVTFNYSNEPLDLGLTTTGSEPGAPSGAPGQGNQTQAPDARPWQVQIDTVEVSVPLTEDVLTGKAVTASNGQPFDPPFEVPAYRPQITITGFKAIGADSYANVANYVGKVNAGVWLGLPAETVMCKKYSLQTQYEQGAWFWQKTVVVEVKADKWNPVKILDQGTFTLESQNYGKPPQPIKDLSGNPANGPMPLNGAGKPLSITDILAGNFTFLSFNAYRKVNFGAIL